MPLSRSSVPSCRMEWFFSRCLVITLTRSYFIACSLNRWWSLCSTQLLINTSPGEANPLAGLANNVCSTDQVCCAVANGVGQVVLISTDKAVRPTNVMGLPSVWLNWWYRPTLLRSPALVFDGALWKCSAPLARWCPCFADRLLPVGSHLTHPEIIRFFGHPRGGIVGAPVFCARSGGDVFLLDMGEPVRIKNLAEQMVRLRGCHCLSGPSRWGH